MERVSVLIIILSLRGAFNKIIVNKPFSPSLIKVT